MNTVPCVVLGLSEDILLILMILQIYFLASCWSLKLFGSKLCLHIFWIWVKYVRWIFWVLPIPFIFNFSATSSGFSLDWSLHPTPMIKCLGDFLFGFVLLLPWCSFCLHRVLVFLVVCFYTSILDPKIFHASPCWLH